MSLNDGCIQVLRAKHLSSVLSLFGLVENGFFLADGVWNEKSLGRVLDHNLSLATFDDEELVGALLVLDNKEAFEVVYLATHPDYRRHGIMKRLLLQLISDASNHGRQLWLEVKASNKRAQKLYSTLGFQVVGERKNYYPNGEAAYVLNGP